MGWTPSPKRKKKSNGSDSENISARNMVERATSDCGFPTHPMPRILLSSAKLSAIRSSCTRFSLVSTAKFLPHRLPEKQEVQHCENDCNNEQHDRTENTSRHFLENKESHDNSCDAEEVVKEIGSHCSILFVNKDVLF